MCIRDRCRNYLQQYVTLAGNRYLNGKADIALNIDVCDLYAGMEFEKLQQYDVVYLCGGNTHYLLERINATRFNKSLMEYINDNGLVIGISAGSPLKNNVKLTNTCALVIRDFPDGVEIIGE